MFNNKSNNSYSNNRSGGYTPAKAEFEFSKKGYFQNGIIREELITTEAKKIAQDLAENRLTATQMRAFFNEVKAIKNRVKEDGTNFPSVYPLILMMNSKVEYRAGSKKIPAYFKDFLVSNIEQISSENKKSNGKEAFDAFVMFFEAVVGYSAGNLK